MMEKTGGRARRSQLFAAVSVLGISLGMAEVAHAAKEDATTQSSYKEQASAKGQSSLKYQTGQSSLKYGAGQSSLKLDQHSVKMQGSYKHNIGGQSSIKGEAQ